jgi:hypothetical protein
MKKPGATDGHRWTQISLKHDEKIFLFGCIHRYSPIFTDIHRYWQRLKCRRPGYRRRRRIEGNQWPQKGAKSAEVLVVVCLWRFFEAIPLASRTVYATDFSEPRGFSSRRLRGCRCAVGISTAHCRLNNSSCSCGEYGTSGDGQKTYGSVLGTIFLGLFFRCKGHRLKRMRIPRPKKRLQKCHFFVVRPRISCQNGRNLSGGICKVLNSKCFHFVARAKKTEKREIWRETKIWRVAWRKSKARESARTVRYALKDRSFSRRLGRNDRQRNGEKNAVLFLSPTFLCPFPRLRRALPCIFALSAAGRAATSNCPIGYWLFGLTMRPGKMKLTGA